MVYRVAQFEGSRIRYNRAALYSRLWAGEDTLVDFTEIEPSLCAFVRSCVRVRACVYVCA